MNKDNKCDIGRIQFTCTCKIRTDCRHFKRHSKSINPNICTYGHISCSCPAAQLEALQEYTHDAWLSFKDAAVGQTALTGAAAMRPRANKCNAAISFTEIGEWNPTAEDMKEIEQLRKDLFIANTMIDELTVKIESLEEDLTKASDEIESLEYSNYE